MIETLIGIILLPFAIGAAVFTIAFGAGIVKYIKDKNSSKVSEKSCE